MHSSTRLRSLAALGAGLTWFVSGSLLLVHPGLMRDIDITTTDEHVVLGLFSLGLVLTAVALGAVVRLGLPSPTRRSVLAARAVPVALIALAAASAASNIHGTDYAWFPAAAVPANLVWLAGMVVLAIDLRRAGRLPAWVALTLPAHQVLNLPLSFIGGGIVSGAIWLAVGALCLSGSQERVAGRPAAA